MNGLSHQHIILQTHIDTKRRRRRNPTCFWKHLRRSSDLPQSLEWLRIFFFVFGIYIVVQALVVQQSRQSLFSSKKKKFRRQQLAAVKRIVLLSSLYVALFSSPFSFCFYLMLSSYFPPLCSSDCQGFTPSLFQWTMHKP